MTVGNKDVTCGEFVRIYTKNNPNAKFDSASIAEYLPMFIDYKLKVVEAEAQKLDTASEFKKELQKRMGNGLQQEDIQYQEKQANKVS